MSPSIYTSFEIDDDDSILERQKKLYLGMISCGEQAYTLGAAIAECRKQLESLDTECNKIKKEFLELKEIIKKRKSNELQKKD